MSKANRPIFPAIHLPQFADEPLPEVVTAKLHHPVTPALDDVASTTRAVLERSHRFKELRSLGAREISSTVRLASNIVSGAFAAMRAE